MDVAGELLDLQSVKPRARSLLRLLAIEPGRLVHWEALVEALWPEASPPAGKRSLQVAVSAVRQLLDPLAPRESSLLTRVGRRLLPHPPRRRPCRRGRVRRPGPPGADRRGHGRQDRRGRPRPRPPWALRRRPAERGGASRVGVEGEGVPPLDGRRPGRDGGRYQPGREVVRRRRPRLPARTRDRQLPRRALAHSRRPPTRPPATTPPPAGPAATTPPSCPSWA